MPFRPPQPDAIDRVDAIRRAYLDRAPLAWILASFQISRARLDWVLHPSRLKPAAQNYVHPREKPR